MSALFDNVHHPARRVGWKNFVSFGKIAVMDFMHYTPRQVANNIIEASFRDEVFITPMKLQRILYLVCSDYAKRTEGTRLFVEPWQTWAYGPVVHSLHDMLSNLGNAPIRQYVRMSHERPTVPFHLLKPHEMKLQGNAPCADLTQDQHLREAVDCIWAATRDYPARGLCEIVRLPGGAWDKAFQSDSPLVSHEDMMSDTTYAAPLGLRH